MGPANYLKLKFKTFHVYNFINCRKNVRPKWNEILENHPCNKIYNKSREFKLGRPVFLSRNCY